MTAIADRLNATPEQVVFRFALQIGMTPLTGTTDQTHMAQDLSALKLSLTDEEMNRLENIAF